jgi:hypothetical protein
MPARTVAINMYKIDVIVETIQGIAEMEDQIKALEIMQNSTDETRRPGEAWIHFQKLVINATKDMCDNQLRSLNQDELRVLGTRI